MNKLDQAIEEIKVKSHAEVMRQAFEILRSVATATDIDHYPEIHKTLNYFYRGSYSDLFTWKSPDINKSNGMSQAFDVVSKITFALDMTSSPHMQKALNYFGHGHYYPNFTWEAPQRKTSDPMPWNGAIKKLANNTSSEMLRYAVTPAGESRGEFVRMLIEKKISTNLYTATSDDLKGVVVAKSTIGDLLNAIPDAISSYYKSRYDRPATVERVDWPNGHPR
jgi:hypothetical protein